MVQQHIDLEQPKDFIHLLEKVERYIQYKEMLEADKVMTTHNKKQREKPQEKKKSGKNSEKFDKSRKRYLQTHQEYTLQTYHGMH